MGNGSRQIYVDSRTLCLASNSTALLVFPNRKSYDESESVCKRHNSNLLDNSLNADVKQHLLMEHITILGNCPFWVKQEELSPNKTNFQKNKPNCSVYEYNATSQQFQNRSNSCEGEFNCIVCAMPVKRMAFRLQTVPDRFLVGSANLFFAHHVGNAMVFFDSKRQTRIAREDVHAWSWKVSSLKYSSNGSEWNDVAEISAEILFGLINITLLAHGSSSDRADYRKARVTNVSLF
jgi:hypothetical protein